MARVHGAHASHNHARLAVPALRNLIRNPGLLHWMALGPGRGESFDGNDLPARGRANVKHTRMLARAVDQDGAGTANFNSAAIFRAGEADRIADHPEQGRARVDIDLIGFAVDVE